MQKNIPASSFHGENCTALTNEKTTLSTVIVEAQEIFATGLKVALRANEAQQLSISKVISQGRALIELLKEYCPDLIIMDLNLTDVDGVEVLKAIKPYRSEASRVVVISAFDNPKIIRSAFRAGADGYLLKNSRLQELYDCLTTVQAGDTYLGTGVHLTSHEGRYAMDQPTSSGSFRSRFARKHCLTRREQEILALIAQAKSNKDIAAELYISDQTVGVHRKNIMRKLDVTNSGALIRLAYENNLL